MYSVFRKKVWESTRSKRFWFLTLTFNVIFPIVLVVLYHTMFTTDTTVRFGNGVDLTINGVGKPMRVAIASANPEASQELMASFPLQKDYLGYPEFSLFTSVDEMTNFIYTNTKTGFPFPFDLGFDLSLPSSPLVMIPHATGSDFTPTFLRGTTVAAQAQMPSFPNLKYRAYPELVDEVVSEAIFASIGPLLYVFGVVFLITSYTNTTVKDKPCKKLLLRTGLHWAKYWLGNWIVDSMTCVVLNFIGFIILMAAQVLPFQHYWVTFLATVILFSMSVPLLAYGVSFLFQEEETAQKWSALVTMLVYFLLSVPSIVVQSLARDNENLQIFVTLAPCFLFPPIALQRALTLMLQFDVFSQGAGTYLTLMDYGYFGMIVGFQIFHLVAFGALVAVLEVKCSCCKRKRKDIEGNDMMVMDDVLLDVKNLSVTYKTRKCCGVSKKEAVKNVSLGSKRGELLAVLGPNGAGKTSLFSVLTGEVEPSSGSASIFGLDCTSDSQLVFRKCAFVEQHDVVLDLLSVWEFLHVIAWVRGGVSDDEIDRFISGMSLQGQKFNRMDQLSGGQRRKVSLIAGLLHNPDLLILDEPTAGIDISSKRFVHDMILEVLKRDGNVIFSSHSMDEVYLLGKSFPLTFD